MRWQYLMVISESSAKQKVGVTPTTWEYLTEAHIWRPGVDEAETRPMANWLHLCNELGAEGWELASEAVLSSTVVANAYGYTEVSIPLRVRYTFRKHEEDA